jgi:copper chaperone CopZ
MKKMITTLLLLTIVLFGSGTFKWKIGGMSCAVCVEDLTDELKEKYPMYKVDLNYTDKILILDGKGIDVNTTTIERIIDMKGYKATRLY